MAMGESGTRSVKSMSLGTNGPLVAQLGVGCHGMTSPRPDDEKECIATLQMAMESGISFFNTADFYGGGQSEFLISKAIQGRRDQAFLSVKFGFQVDPAGKGLGIDGRPESVKNFATYSLARLGVDVIDLYVPGRPDSRVPYEDTIGAVADLIKQGYVKYLGVSEVGADHLRRAHRVHPVTSLEIEYSLACRFIEPEILPVARELGLATVAYRALADGLLGGTMTTKSQDQLHDPFVASRMQGENLKHNLAKVERLKEIARAKDCTVAQLSIAWLLARGSDILPLVGVKSRARLQDCLKALYVSFEPQELELLDQNFANGSFLGDRYPSAFMHLQAH